MRLLEWVEKQKVTWKQAETVKQKILIFVDILKWVFVAFACICLIITTYYILIEISTESDVFETMENLCRCGKLLIKAQIFILFSTICNAIVK